MNKTLAQLKQELIDGRNKVMKPHIPCELGIRIIRAFEALHAAVAEAREHGQTDTFWELCDAYNDITGEL